MRRRPGPVLPLAIAVAWSCSSDPAGPDNGNGNGNGREVQLAVEVVAEGLAFPLLATTPEGDPRLFVVEKAGRILILENGTLRATPFLDISAMVDGDEERGLLGLAFHPGYALNGHFYVNYTDLAEDTHVERYTVSADPNRADPASAKPILFVDQPRGNHNGGNLAFGPDGMLYIGMGDGGGVGDPFDNGQDLGTLHGTLLRIDVDGGDPYAIPDDNPFAGQAGAQGEIWAFGLRNPWRWTFDRAAGVLYVADVGQSSLEEVNAVGAAEAGINYGWNVMEGTRCFGTSSCDTSGLTLPVLEYGHSEGCSITGGLVYRGSAIPQIRGLYFYSDFCAGFLRSFRLVGGAVTETRSWPVGDLGSVVSFGEDAAGELYILSMNGRVYRIVASS